MVGRLLFFVGFMVFKWPDFILNLGHYPCRTPPDLLLYVCQARLLPRVLLFFFFFFLSCLVVFPSLLARQSWVMFTQQAPQAISLLLLCPSLLLCNCSFLLRAFICCLISLIHQKLLFLGFARDHALCFLLLPVKCLQSISSKYSSVTD